MPAATAAHDPALALQLQPRTSSASSDELFTRLPDVAAVCRVTSSCGGAPPPKEQLLKAPGDAVLQRDQQWQQGPGTEDWHAAAAAAPQLASDAAAGAVSPQLKAPLQVEIGKRVFVDEGIDLQSRQSVLTEAFAVLTMAVYLGWIHVLLGLAVASFFSRTAMLTFFGIWATLLIPAQLLWPAFLTNPVWVAWRRYFRFSAVFDAQFELQDTHYVIAEYPHGVFPLSQMVAVSLTRFWPNHPIYCLAADSVFYIPIWRQVMKWIGTVPATAENFRRVLKKGTVGLVPGGIAEMFMVDEEREMIKLLDRKGFVRIAVEQGAPLLPCFHFGNSKLFKWGPKWLERAARKHRIALGVLFGRWNLPLPLPNRVPLMMAVGAPIPTRQTSRDDREAFNAAVDEAHAQLVVAMQELYDKYKGEYGWAERPLIIQ